MGNKPFLPSKKSTRAFYREGKETENYSWLDFAHGYIYGRWPYLYIGVGTGEHPLTRVFLPLFNFFTNLTRLITPPQDEEIGFADTYHGKVVPLGAARDLVMIQEEITIKDLEPVIPYAKARDIVLKNPDHIVVLDCPCRVARQDPCLPLDVCLIVGEPFASFVLEHQPGRSRLITQKEAVAILSEEHERGHVHHAFFKDAMLGRFYAICNCCTCCCGAMGAHCNGTPMLTSSGYVAQLDEGLCTGCGTCAELCQFKAILVSDGRVRISDGDCMGCGVCVGHCQEGALELVLAPEKGEPLLIRELMDQGERPSKG